MNIQEKQKEIKRLNLIACVWKIVAILSVICCIASFNFNILVGTAVFVFGLAAGIISIVAYDACINDISAIDFELLEERLKKEGKL